MAFFPTILRKYNPSYPQWYQIEQVRLKNVLLNLISNELIILVVGLKELNLKPIIDILLEIDRYQRVLLS